MNPKSRKVMELAAYIEEHLQEELSLEILAEAFDLSTFQLHRIFSHLSSMTLMAYIRKRRLAKSLLMLKESSLKVIDIAMELGFDYEQSYIRAFKKEFSITPHQYRKSREIVPIITALKSRDIEILDNGMMLPPNSCFLPKMNYIGKRHRITHQDDGYYELPNQRGVEFFKRDSLLVKGDICRTVYYSRILIVDYHRQVYDYTPSMSYTTLEEIPPGFEDFTLPSREYLHFKYVGNHSPYEIDMHRMAHIYKYIHHNFRSYIEEHCDLTYTLERIDEEICSDSYCEMDYLYPLLRG